MTDWIDYTQCSECGKQCQNGGHCIGGMGGKDTKCPGFIRYVPKIRVEKQVWESTLNHSMVLEAENDKLKEKIERLEKQLKIAVEAIKAVLHDEFILEHADAGLVMYLTQAEYKIKELEK